MTTCPTGLKGPTMSKLPLSSAPEDFFCADTTEVTNAQYALFVSFGTLSGQPAQCSFNVNRAPETGEGCSSTADYDPANKATYPVTCIDWCDAYMYCAWAGKRLCGGVGGGAAPFASRGDPGSSQWHNACTLNGTRTFPYGSSYQSGRCNDVSSSTSGPFFTSGYPTCSGNWTGELPMYDMSGNVAEWEDSCSGTQCSSRGGDWNANSTTAACGSLAKAAISARDQHRGFRCCWDPPAH